MYLIIYFYFILSKVLVIKWFHVYKLIQRIIRNICGLGTMLSAGGTKVNKSMPGPQDEWVR